MNTFISNKAENLVAAIDLGSNSFKLMIAKIVLTNGIYHIEELDTIKESIKIASGLNNKGILSEKYVKKAYETLIRFGDRLRRFDQNSVTAVGTFTLRSVKNKNFLENAQKLLGFNIDIISGEEEAAYIYDGVMHLSPESEGDQLIIDVGGGSTEIIIGDRKKLLNATSLTLGCVTSAVSFFDGTKITEQSFKRAVDHAKKIIHKNISKEFHAPKNVIGTSGTCRAIADIILLNNLDTTTNSPIDEIGGFITLKGINKIKQELLDAGDVECSTLSGIKNERKPVIASGLSILAALFEELKIKQMEVTESALLYGSIHRKLFNLIGRPDKVIGAYKKIIPIDFNDLNRDQCEEEIKILENKFYVDDKQTQRVFLTASHFANHLIKKNSDLKILLWAIRLLEIGKSIKLKNYQIYSSYIISNSELHGFTNKEKIRLSTLVHAHRSSLSKYNFNINYIDWSMLFIIRISYILCKNRELINVANIKIINSDKELKIKFEKEWLTQNPYLAFRLGKEKSYWKKINSKFKIYLD
jgi:exopolyphosphatase / guanosine-5'-triphosphate,3'-diphosphate pyrophosphatase